MGTVFPLVLALCQTITIFHHPCEVFGDAFCGGWIFSPCAIPPKELHLEGICLSVISINDSLFQVWCLEKNR